MDNTIKYPVYLALIGLGSTTPEKQHIFMTTESNELHAFECLEEGLRFFEEGYAHSHARGYEASMSAAINHLFFEPWIVRIDSWEEVTEAVGAPPYRTVQARHVSGFMSGILVLPADVSKLKARGVQPRII